MRVLVVEDDSLLRRNVGEMLRSHRGFVVHDAREGMEGLLLASSGSYDLVVLDLNLPQLDGLTVLARLRDRGVPTPVLVLTARNTPEDVVRTLEAGGDDHLAKPFAMEELLARASALVRRSLGHATPRIDLGDVTVDLVARRIEHRGEPVDLPALEFRMLEHLALHRGRIRSKAELIDALWERHEPPSDNAVEVLVSSLRRRFGHELVRTVRNLGYVVDGPDR